MTFGRYISGNTPLHRLDPRAKILCAICFMGAVFGTRFFFTAIPLIVVLLGLARLAKLPWRVIWQNLLPIMPILAVTCLLNAVMTPGHPLTFGTVKWDAITEEGIYRGVQIAGRLCAVVMIAALLTLTTSPLELADGLESLFRPLRHLRLPTGEFALALTIALRFVPTLFDEADRLFKAQMARGADFSGNVFRRIPKMLPLLLPLLVSAFSRADRLAIALELRGYQTSGLRTRFVPLLMTRYDRLVLLSVFLLMVCVL